MEAEPVPISEVILAHLSSVSIPFDVIFGSLILIILLLTSALISGSEVAFFSLSPLDKQTLKEKDERAGELVLRLLDIPEKLLATILVGNNFVNIAIVLLSAFVIESVFDFSQMSPLLNFIIQTIGITFLLLLFGEIIPKVYATQFSRRFALRMAPFLNLLEKIFRPINAVLIASTNLVNNRFNKHQSSDVSVSDLSQALELTSEDELSSDKDILEGIVTFGSKSVVDIMRSRLDVEAFDFNTKFSKVIAVFNESGYSRIPVYTDTFDNVKGILYSKDLLSHIHKGETFRWQTLIRPPFYVPETKKIDNLLGEFQKTKVHMAIVVDEYGGTSGIVTLEDVLEEIVGDISDEFDEDESFYTKISEREYLFDGKTLLNDFYKVIDSREEVFDSVKGEADTLAGLILELKGDFPAKHEEIPCKGFLFSITSSDARRIKQISVILPK